MRTEVRTRQELVSAILNNADTIHIAETRLAAELLSKPKKDGFISYVMRMNGYKQTCTRALGVFDVSLIQVKEQAS
jgi:hypothetical protein